MSRYDDEMKRYKGIRNEFIEWRHNHGYSQFRSLEDLIDDPDLSANDRAYLKELDARWGRSLEAAAASA